MRGLWTFLRIIFRMGGGARLKFAEQIITQQPKQRYCWCIDNGHGALQAGKRSPIFEDGTQLLEYEFNRDIALRIMEQLRELGIQYYDVVPDVEEVGAFLAGRVKRANDYETHLPKIFLSIHGNAYGEDGVWYSPSGIETWCHKHSIKSFKIAEIFQQKLVDRLGWRNRGVKMKKEHEEDFYVLRETNMPAALTENGIYSNKKQCKEMSKDSIRQRIANAHVDAILEIEINGL